MATAHATTDRDEAARLETRLSDANQRIGYLEAEWRIEQSVLAKVKAERDALRAAMLAQITLLESLSPRAEVEDLHRAIDHAVERLDAALYQNERTVAALNRWQGGGRVATTDSDRDATTRGTVS